MDRNSFSIKVSEKILIPLREKPFDLMYKIMLASNNGIVNMVSLQQMYFDN